MNAKDFEQAMRDAGATDQQINTKTYQLAERLIANDAVDGVSTAASMLESVEQRIRTADGNLKRALESASRQGASLRESIAMAQTISADVDERTKELSAAIDGITVKDPIVRDSINAYTLVLLRTKQVFGEENMTESLMEKAIEAASYGMWRSIMGPKEADKQQKSVGRVRL